MSTNQEDNAGVWTEFDCPYPDKVSCLVAYAKRYSAEYLKLRNESSLFKARGVLEKGSCKTSFPDDAPESFTLVCYIAVFLDRQAWSPELNPARKDPLLGKRVKS